MKIGTTKEYNNMLKAACRMENAVRFYNSNDELCRRKICETLLELEDEVDKWKKSIDDACEVAE